MITIYDDRTFFGSPLPISDEVMKFSETLFLDSPFYHDDPDFYVKYHASMFVQPLTDSKSIDSHTLAALLNTDITYDVMRHYIRIPSLTVGQVAYAVARYTRIFNDINDHSKPIYVQDEDYFDSIFYTKMSNAHHNERMLWAVLQRVAGWDLTASGFHHFIANGMNFDNVISYFTHGSRDIKHIIRCYNENIDPHLAASLEVYHA